MFILPTILLAIFLIYVVIFKGFPWQFALGTLASHLIVILLIYTISVSVVSTDTEVWSGSVIDVVHKEEYDKWIPPSTETRTRTKTRYVNGQSQSYTETYTVTIPGKWEHYNAENYIKTSDGGTFSVHSYKDRNFNDHYPNTTEELKQYWNIGDPTASVHTYTNKVQASYSVLNRPPVDLTLYEGLPTYPEYVENYTRINRLLGYFPNYTESRWTLDKQNTRLNKLMKTSEVEKLENRTILAEGEEDKKRSWKQVNIIFVNLGEGKSRDWGFALQDYWENGNKNDFIVSMSMDEEGKVSWVYPFCWSEVELLKLKVKNNILDRGIIRDFKPVVDDVADLVAKHFIRKEFKDFEYLQVPIPKTSYVLAWIFMVVAVGIVSYLVLVVGRSRKYL